MGINAYISAAGPAAELAFGLTEQGCSRGTGWRAASVGRHSAVELSSCRVRRSGLFSLIDPPKSPARFRPAAGRTDDGRLLGPFATQLGLEDPDPSSDRPTNRAPARPRARGCRRPPLMATTGRARAGNSKRSGRSIRVWGVADMASCPGPSIGLLPANGTPYLPMLAFRHGGTVGLWSATLLNPDTASLGERSCSGSGVAGKLAGQLLDSGRFRSHEGRALRSSIVN